MAQTPLAIVIGAGLGGLAAAIRLKMAGHEVVILEQADQVGGTWRDNRYPGCACDTPVALYQFSFAPSLDWNHVFPRAPEVQRYAEQLCDLFGLRASLRLGCGARRAVWSESDRLWRVTDTHGAVHEAPFLVPALGQLNRPAMPDIPGRDAFAGPAFHSARWREDVDLAGKRVGVIGSAASAVQLVPEVAKIAGHLTVFQRSPNWLLPRLDREVTAEEKALLMTAPEIAMKARDYIYENADHFFWQAFQFTPQGRAAYTRQALMHLEAQVSDPALRAKLTPSYPIGCKRILFCDDYYPALQRPNVALVTDRIERITPAGVTTADGRGHDLDVLVFATGFETTGWQWSLDVVGRDGRSLHEAWADAPEAYLGLAVAGFPNLFMLYGPNTNLGHNTITFMIERQADYIVQAAAALAARGAKAMEPTPAAQARFNAELQAQLAHTTWADPACASWYKTADGRITQNWGSHTRDYAAATATVAEADYAFLD